MISKITRFLVKISKQERSEQYKLISLVVGVSLFTFIFPCLFIFIYKSIASNSSVRRRLRQLGKIIALPLILGGLLIDIWAALTHWKAGKGTPAPIAPTSKLITTGPYSLCRNPIQLGTAIYYLGLGILAKSLKCGVSMSGLTLLLGSLYHKFIEEKELEERFGDEYKEYKKKTPFLFPKRFTRT